MQTSGVTQWNGLELKKHLISLGFHCAIQSVFGNEIVSVLNVHIRDGQSRRGRGKAYVKPIREWFEANHPDIAVHIVKYDSFLQLSTCSIPAFNLNPVVATNEDVDCLTLLREI